MLVVFKNKLTPGRIHVKSTVIPQFCSFKNASVSAQNQTEQWLQQNRWHQNGPDYVQRCKIHYRSMREGKDYLMNGVGTINQQFGETVILESHFMFCMEINSSWVEELNVFFSNLKISERHRIKYSSLLRRKNFTGFEAMWEVKKRRRSISWATKKCKV